MGKRVVALSAVLLVVVVLVLALRISIAHRTLPNLIENATRRIADSLDVVFEIQEVKTVGLRELRLTQLTVKVSDATQPDLLSASEVSVRFRLLPLLRKRLIIEEIEIPSCKVNLFRSESGTLNWPLPLPRGTDVASPSHWSNLTPSIKALSFSKIDIEYHDAVSGKSVSLTDGTLTSAFSNVTRFVTFRLSGELRGSMAGHVVGCGTYDLAEGIVDLSLTGQDVPLASYCRLPPFQGFGDVESLIQSGQTNINLRLTMNASHWSAAGRLRVEEARLSVPSIPDKLSGQIELHVAGEIPARRVTLSRISLDLNRLKGTAYGTLEDPKGAMNLSLTCHLTEFPEQYLLSLVSSLKVPNGADVILSEVTLPALDVSVRGTIRQPDIAGTLRMAAARLQLQGDIQPSAPIIAMLECRDVHIDWDKSNESYSGRFLVANGKIEWGGLPGPIVGLTGEIGFDNKALHLSEVQGQLLDAVVSASGGIGLPPHPWLAFTLRAETPTLARFSSWLPLPDGLEVEGGLTATGTVQRADRLESELDLDLADTGFRYGPIAKPKGVPMNLSARIVAEGHEVRLENIVCALPDMTARGTAFIDRGGGSRAQLNLQAAPFDLEAILPYLDLHTALQGGSVDGLTLSLEREVEESNLKRSTISASLRTESLHLKSPGSDDAVALKHFTWKVDSDLLARRIRLGVEGETATIPPSVFRHGPSTRQEDETTGPAWDEWRFDADLKVRSVELAPFTVSQFHTVLDGSRDEVNAKSVSMIAYGGALQGQLRVLPTDWGFQGSFSWDKIDLNQLISRTTGTSGKFFGELTGQLDMKGNLFDPSTYVGKGYTEAASGLIDSSFLIGKIAGLTESEPAAPIAFSAARSDAVVENSSVRTADFTLTKRGMELRGKGNLKFNGDLSYLFEMEAEPQVVNQIPWLAERQNVLQRISGQQVISFSLSGNIREMRSELHKQPLEVMLAETVLGAGKQAITTGVKALELSGKLFVDLLKL